MCSCRKMLSIILAASFVFGSVPISARAAGQANDCALFLDIFPEKTEHQKGEDVQFRTRLHNSSLNDMQNVYIWMEYDSGEAMLYPHSTERVVEALPYSDTTDLSFCVISKKSTEKIESINIPVLKSLAARAVRLFPKITRHFVFLKNDLRTFFRSFSSAQKTRYTAELGSSTVIYGGREITFTFKCSYTLTKQPVNLKTSAEAQGANRASVNFAAPKEGFAGLVFGADIQSDGNFDGWFFYINASDGTAGIAEKIQNEYKAVARRKIEIQQGKTYTLCVQKTIGGVKAWLLNNPSEKDTTFPLFDIAVSPSCDGWGTICADTGVYSDFRSDDVPYALPEKTYCNPVHTNAPDPFVLYEDGVYYLYSTNAVNDGFYADVSTDLVHWSRHSQLVADKKDLYGDYWFWAPEVYRFNGKYYMIYSAEEHIAVAVADSPLGPFKKAGDGFLLEEKAIDGSLLFDDDGKIYLYYAKLENTENIYVAEMEADLLHCKAGNETQLSSPEGWENNVNEGPAVIKHNGTYYLTYSGPDYRDANYSVGCMTSNSPTGPFTRDALNPVLKSNLLSPGCGHHCFAPSPDGSELFIVYHCHYSAEAVHPRCLCIDRARFVPSEDGADRFVIGGPTSTPQPMPK